MCMLTGLATQAMLSFPSLKGMRFDRHVTNAAPTELNSGLYVNAYRRVLVSTLWGFFLHF
jgi:hypothetical protein